MTLRNVPLIPDDYVSRVARNEVGGKRTITVRKYTAIPYQTRTEVVSAIKKSRLTYGDAFGVIQEHDLAEHDLAELERNPRMLCGLVGERNVILISHTTNKPDYLKLRHVLLATLMVEFIVTDEKLELLIYGGKQGHSELINLFKENFGITQLLPHVFTDVGVRNLCENRFDRLFTIDFDPYDMDGWGTIQAANFKSGRGQFIKHEVERMKQIRDNKDILIRSFRSVLHNQMIEPLQNVYDIRFEVLKDRGVSIEIPELKLPPAADLSYEAILYDFARQAYSRIVGEEELQEAESEPVDDQGQMKLFDDLDLFGDFEL